MISHNHKVLERIKARTPRPVYKPFPFRSHKKSSVPGIYWFLRITLGYFLAFLPMQILVEKNQMILALVATIVGIFLLDKAVTWVILRWAKEERNSCRNVRRNRTESMKLAKAETAIVVQKFRDATASYLRELRKERDYWTSGIKA